MNGFGLQALMPVREWQSPDPSVFAQEIYPQSEPAILRGLVKGWPIVSAAKNDPRATLARLRDSAAKCDVEYAAAPHELGGLLHYLPDLSAFTFSRRKSTFPDFIEMLAAASQHDQPHSLALQSTDAETLLPGFTAAHSMPLVPPEVRPKIWIGNRAVVATHNDPADNIACVVAGRRRFTLFPPDQIGNLYMGPLHVTPAGTPISMVHVTDPDFDRYPRFANALRAAMVAELGPGDAIFIPYHWYHHVEALEPVNVLVNYWWGDAASERDLPWLALLASLSAIRHLPENQRRAWRAAFDNYVFLQGDNPAAHLPEFARGMLGRLNAEERGALRRNIAKAFNDAPS